MERLFCIVIGYIFGLFQTGYLYGRLVGVDLRHEGSGNSGTTNALRVMGKKAGALVFLGDVLKFWLAILLTTASAWCWGTTSPSTWASRAEKGSRSRPP